MSTSKTIGDSYVAVQPQYPLTENQKVLWIAHEMEQKAGLYHEPVSIQIKGDLDVQRLQKHCNILLISMPLYKCVLSIHQKVLNK